MDSVVAMLVLVVVGLCPASADDKKDQDALQGTWAVVSATRGGKPNDSIKNDKLVFEGTTVTVKTASGRDEPATFKLDSSKSPKTIDIMPKEGDQKIQGIYKLSGDMLEICFNRDERPTEFKSAEGSRNFLVVLKREKK